MTHPLIEEILKTAKFANEAHRAAFEQGRLAGRREARAEFYDLVRAMCDMIDSLEPDDGEARDEAEALIDRAGEMLQPKTGLLEGESEHE